MKSIGVLLNLLHHFKRGIQCDKICNSVHDEASELQHEMQILGVKLKRHTNSIMNVQFPSNFPAVYHQSCVFDASVNFYKLLNYKC